MSTQEISGISWRIEEWFPDLSPDVKSKLKSFHEALLVGSKNYSSLISIKTLPVADVLHFADSILASRIILQHHEGLKSLHDFGTGAGFPGMVFAILNPAISVTLVDYDVKKVEFLKEVASSLKLSNVIVEGKTVESLPEGSVQAAVVRGFSNISKTVLSARKCVVKGGALYHLKGEEWGIELAEIPSQLCSIWSPSLVGEYRLPIGAFKFAVIKTDKIA